MGRLPFVGDDDEKPALDLTGKSTLEILAAIDLFSGLPNAHLKRVVAIGLDYANSTLQVQPFAAPRSSGLWHEIRDQISDQIAKQGGTTTLREGPFGPELLAQIPVASATATPGTTRLARFIGVDGPRWFLRGVIAGEGAVNADAAAAVEDLFRSIVVVRGTTPMPPRDLIPLRMPANPAGDTTTGV